MRAFYTVRSLGFSFQLNHDEEVELRACYLEYLAWYWLSCGSAAYLLLNDSDIVVPHSTRCKRSTVISAANSPEDLHYKTFGVHLSFSVVAGTML